MKNGWRKKYRNCTRDRRVRPALWLAFPCVWFASPGTFLHPSPLFRETRPRELVVASTPFTRSAAKRHCVCVSAGNSRATFVINSASRLRRPARYIPVQTHPSSEQDPAKHVTRTLGKHTAETVGMFCYFGRLRCVSFFRTFLRSLSSCLFVCTNPSIQKDHTNVTSVLSCHLDLCHRRMGVIAQGLGSLHRLKHAAKHGNVCLASPRLRGSLSKTRFTTRMGSKHTTRASHSHSKRIRRVACSACFPPRRAKSCFWTVVKMCDDDSQA